MITVVKRFTIAAGHRLMAHKGKCRNLHGHTYNFEVEVERELAGIGVQGVAPIIDGAGMLIDFSNLDTTIGGWLKDNWDHAFLVERSDAVVLNFLVDNGMKHFAFDCAPSAENLANFLALRAETQLLPPDFHARRVRCEESPTSYAEWRR